MHFLRFLVNTNLFFKGLLNHHSLIASAFTAQLLLIKSQETLVTCALHQFTAIFQSTATLLYTLRSSPTFAHVICFVSHLLLFHTYTNSSPTAVLSHRTIRKQPVDTHSPHLVKQTQTVENSATFVSFALRIHLLHTFSHPLWRNRSVNLGTHVAHRQIANNVPKASFLAYSARFEARAACLLSALFTVSHVHHQFFIRYSTPRGALSLPAYSTQVAHTQIRQSS